MKVKLEVRNPEVGGEVEGEFIEEVKL